MLCSCGLDIETTCHLLHCPLFHDDQSTLLDNIKETDSTSAIIEWNIVIDVKMDGSVLEEK